MQSDTILHKADRATEPTHVIDPDGEVIIILEDENRNFAVWDEDAVIDYTAAASVVAEGVSSGPSSTFEIPVISRKGNKKKDKKHRKRGLASRLTPEPEPQPEVEAEAEIEVELEPAADNAVASLNGDVQLDEETAEIAESVGQYFTGHVDSGEIVEHESFSIQVSAKHLTMASPHLKSTLRGGWKESITELNKGSVEIVCKDWDLEALLIVLKIIHCQHNELPRTIDLDLLAKVAVIADYYECTDKTRFFADRWIENLEQNFPLTYSRDLMLWLWISWLYRLPVQFEKSTSIAMTQSKSTITTLGLPIPNKILGMY